MEVIQIIRNTLRYFERKMRRKTPPSSFSALCAVVLTTSVLTYFTLYKKNNLMAIEVEKTSKIWPQKTSSAASKALTSLQNNIHKLTSSTSSKSKPELPANTISKILEDSKKVQLPDHSSDKAVVYHGTIKVTKFDIRTLNGDVTKEQPWCLSVLLIPKYTICIYMPEEDFRVSKHIVEKGMFRPQLTSIVRKIFEVFPEITFLDIGANLGYFSLMASSLGHHTIAVEAVASNAYRINEAALRSNLSVDLYRYAIGESQSTTSYLFQGDISTGNRGHGKVMDDGESPEYFAMMYEPVQTITITQFLKANSDLQTFKIFMKIDLDTEECKVFNGNEGIFTTYKIPIILMRWPYLIFDPTLPRSKSYELIKGSECSLQEIEYVVTFLMEFSGYSPFDVETRKPLFVSDLLGTDKSSWLSLQTDHHVLWLHHSIPEVEKSKVLRIIKPSKQEMLLHFHDLAQHYQISPLELNDGKLMIQNHIYSVFNDNSVRTSWQDEPLTDEKLMEIAQTL